MYWVRLFLCVPFLYLGWSGSRPVGDLHSQVSPGEHDSSSQVLVGWPKHQFFHLTLDLDSIWKQWACFTWKTIAQTYPVRSSYFFVNQYLWFQYTCSPSCNQVNATTQVSLIFAHWLFGLWWHIQYGTWIDDRVMGQAGWVHTNISCDYIYIAIALSMTFLTSCRGFKKRFTRCWAARETSSEAALAPATTIRRSIFWCLKVLGG